MNGKKSLIAIAAISLVAACGCSDVDIFSRDQKQLVKGYRLEKLPENQRFYVRKKGDESPGGVFDGTIVRIGWNNDYILAEVDRLFGGDRDGWYSVETKSGALAGPLTSQEVTNQAHLRSIRCVSPQVVFGPK